MDLEKRALDVHYKHKGKLSVEVKTPVLGSEDLSLIYSPGVAEPCKVIHAEEDKAYDYTVKGNSVAVVTNGSAVLGMGDIGATAAIPVMEGKSALFKLFADIDAFPVCLDTNDVDEIIRTVRILEPAYGGINLEDIKAPECFVIEERLKEELDIPVFHDDQHGTAIVTASGLINALKVTGKTIDSIKVVVNGAGAAGIAVAKILRSLGVSEIVLCDSKGAIYEGRSYAMNPIKEEQAVWTNPNRIKGSLEKVIRGADVFIGVSIANALTSAMVKTMNKDPIIFAMANPIPEIMPEDAKLAGARVIGTGRSDFPNQVNNVLAFPGIFRGALNARAKKINESMKIAAVYALAGLISNEELQEDNIIPTPFQEGVATNVAKAVEQAAIESGVARLPEEVAAKI